ncbi:auxin-induced protein 6B-like [Zingiber officinale]|uniref:Uncharacterized protein n=1 Tax=Zingiber officinale TaxID=94328 RepID=A0A8J5EEM8_ZINOF|nr:auxin-induced protein 6B-like [Zingiber officinale]KAG6474469.1 hypothetical protein ZIOFF_068406 [Zingiber officinale]
MDSKRPNKITEVVRLQQMLKKWKKLTVSPTGSSCSSRQKSIKFLKRNLSFSSSGNSNITRGCLAVCVGEEMQRFVIPTEYLSHRAFEILLREAEDEFGFEQEGVLRIPCKVSVFESIVRVVEENKEEFCY